LVEADTVFASARTGETIDVASHLRSVFQTLSGRLQWVQVAQISEVTLATTPDENKSITLYYCGEYLGMDVPAHITITTADGWLNQVFTGQFGLSKLDRLDDTTMNISLPSGALRIDQVIAPGLQTSDNSDWSVVLELSVGADGSLPFESATLQAERPKSDAGVNTRLTLGLANFGASF